MTYKTSVSIRKKITCRRSWYEALRYIGDSEWNILRVESVASSKDYFSEKEREKKKKCRPDQRKTADKIKRWSIGKLKREQKNQPNVKLWNNSW